MMDIRDGGNDHRQAHILLMESNEHERTVLTHQLQRMGHTVTHANSSYEALELLTSDNFDLVLLDFTASVLGGLQVLERIRSDRGHVPVLVISATDDIENMIKSIELGAEDYLLKPVNEALLRAHVSAALEKKWLRDRERAYLAAIHHEMQLGRQIQADFMPMHIPRIRGWRIATRFLPANQVSGDFFDIFRLPHGHLSLVIGDVSGKGVGAALFMALIRTLLRAFSDSNNGSPEAVLNAVRHTNRYILRHHQQQTSMFTTLFVGVLTPRTGELKYINAGHVPPVLSRLNGSQHLLLPSGPAIGVTEELPFEEHITHLDPGDLLLLYTDGVTEAMNAKHELFGIERLQEISRCVHLPPQHLLRCVETHLIAHSGRNSFSDDVTMLAIKRILCKVKRLPDYVPLKETLPCCSDAGQLTRTQG